MWWSFAGEDDDEAMEEDETTETKKGKGKGKNKHTQKIEGERELGMREKKWYHY